MYVMIKGDSMNELSTDPFLQQKIKLSGFCLKWYWTPVYSSEITRCVAYRKPTTGNYLL